MRLIITSWCSFVAVLMLSSVLTGSALGMTFDLEERCINGLTPRCQQMVVAEGLISKDTPAEFKEWSKNLPKGTWIAITSPGGSVIGGMQLGALFRTGGFNTTIGNTDISPTNCLSACAYAFVGGVTRYLPPGSRYGLHQYYSPDKTISTADAQKLNVMMAKYLDTMGVDRRVLDFAQSTTHDKMTILSQAQAKQLRVDNLGQSPYPRWRLEATPDGKIIAINSTVLQGRIPVNIGLVNLNQKIIFVIYYKSSDEIAFVTRAPHRLIIGNQSYQLSQLNAWQEKNGGYQANFDIPSGAIEALGKLPEDTFALLQGEFFHIPTGLQAPVEIKFGVAGLKNALPVLMK